VNSRAALVEGPNPDHQPGSDDLAGNRPATSLRNAKAKRRNLQPRPTAKYSGTRAVVVAFGKADAAGGLSMLKAMWYISEMSLRPKPGAVICSAKSASLSNQSFVGGGERMATVSDIAMIRDGGSIQFRVSNSDANGLYRLQTPLLGTPQPLFKDGSRLEFGSAEEMTVLAALRQWLAASLTKEVLAAMAELHKLPLWQNLPKRLLEVVPLHRVRLVIQRLEERLQAEPSGPPDRTGIRHNGQRWSYSSLVRRFDIG
jgi:hypothetical protein